MKDLSHSCIFSGATENLNTIIEVTLDDEKYKVAISDEYEDAASLGEIKKLIPAYLQQLTSKLDQLKALAEELGYVLVKKGEVIEPAVVAANKIVSPQPEAVLSDKPTTVINETPYKVQKNTREDSEPVSAVGMSREEANAALEAAKREARNLQGAPSPTPGEAASYNKHYIPESVEVRNRNGNVQSVEGPKRGAKTIQTVKGAAGLPTIVPKNIYGTDGETTISIVNTGGDKVIQNRGRQLAAMREYGDETSYSQLCRPCQGTGLRGKKNCSSCNGTGILI